MTGPLMGTPFARGWFASGRDSLIRVCKPHATSTDVLVPIPLYDGLAEVAEAAADVMNHGLDHLNGKIRMADGSVQSCPLCVALERLKEAKHV